MGGVCVQCVYYVVCFVMNVGIFHFKIMYVFSLEILSLDGSRFKFIKKDRMFLMDSFTGSVILIKLYTPPPKRSHFIKHGYVHISCN